MRRTIYSSLLLILFFSVQLYSAQWVTKSKFANNWFFGKGTGLTFNTPDSIPVTFQAKVGFIAGQVSMSDKAGNLLFFADMYKVYDRNQEPMPNGFLNMVQLPYHFYNYGDKMYSFPMPGNPNKYYIFYKNERYKNKICYAIVDMTLRDGLGDVVKIDTIENDSLNYGICTVPHRNNYFVWLLSVNFAKIIQNPVIKAYLITEDGIKYQTETSIPFLNYDTGIVGTGPLEVTINADRILCTNICLDDGYHYYGMMLAKFDNETGELSEFLRIRDKFPYSQAISYGFSPNGKKIYAYFFNSDDPPGNPRNSIAQFDISNHDSLSIANSIKTLYTFGFYGQNRYQYHDMTLGPDGRIYCGDFEVSGRTSSYFHIIENPNSDGLLAKFKARAIYLGDSVLVSDLPRYMYDYDPTYAKLTTNAPVCVGDTLRIKCVSDSAKSVSWAGPNGFKSNSFEIVIPNPLPEHVGRYYSTVKFKQFELVDSIDISLYPKPGLRILGSETLCSGDTMTIEAQTDEDNCTLRWNNGSTERAIRVFQAGTYQVIAETENGCKDTAKIKIEVLDKLQVKIFGNEYFCPNESVVLRGYPSVPGYTYEWSTGDSTQDIVVDEEGIYRLKITSPNGCSGESEFEVKTGELPVIDIFSDRKEVCFGGSLMLKALTDSKNRIRWSTDEVTDSIIIQSPGIYFVYAVNEFGCKDTAFIEITEYIMPKPKIIGEMQFCTGVPIVLKTDNDYETILWNTGENSSSIEVMSEGEYWYHAIDKSGCYGWSDTVSVTEKPAPILNIVGNLEICEGGWTTLQTSEEFETYLWSTGETTRQITVTAPGEYQVEVSSQNQCKATKKVEVKLIEASFEGITDIDFEMVKLNLLRNKTLYISNPSNYVLHVKSVEFSGDTEISVLTEPQAPAKIPPGEMLVMEVFFKPVLKKTYTGKIKIEIDEPCNKIYEIDVIGSGKGLGGRITVWLPDTSAYVGDKDFCIPLYARIENGENAGNLSYTAELSFDADALITYLPNKGVVESNMRKIVLTNNNISLSNKDTIIGKFCGDVLLGGKSLIPLFIENINWSEEIDNDTHDGSLKLLFCQINLAALKLFQSTQIALMPNPASDELDIDISSGESGLFKLEIYSIEGALIDMRNWCSSGKHDTKLKLDLSKYSTGVYMVVLSSPTSKKAEQLKIVK